MTPTPELNKALAAFQAELPRITKGTTADTGTYKYDYAELDVVAQAVLPLLGKHGLAYIAEPTTDDDGKLVLDYALLHESGQERPKRFPLWRFAPERANAQTIGGLITYFRRYCLLAVSGVHPGGEDDDGAAVSHEKPPEAATQRPAARRAAPVNGVSHIMSQFNRLQVTDPGVQLGYAATLTGHAVNHLDELTTDEQRTLFTALKKSPNQAALDQQSKQEAMA